MHCREVPGATTLPAPGGLALAPAAPWPLWLWHRRVQRQLRAPGQLLIRTLAAWEGRGLQGRTALFLSDSDGARMPPAPRLPRSTCHLLPVGDAGNRRDTGECDQRVSSLTFLLFDFCLCLSPSVWLCPSAVALHALDGAQVSCEGSACPFPRHQRRRGHRATQKRQTCDSRT